jgi:hypothetical protein
LLPLPPAEKDANKAQGGEAALARWAKRKGPQALATAGSHGSANHHEKNLHIHFIAKDFAL